MRSGLPFSRLVLFEDGAPDGAVSWVLRDLAGNQLTTGSVTPEAGAVSTLVVVPADFNTLGVGDPLRITRDLDWSYTTSGAVRSGSTRYFVEGVVPFPVSTDGVRTLVGIPAHNLPDEEISLIEAFWDFQTLVGSDNLVPFTGVDGASSAAIARGIEAKAALRLLPGLPARVASKEGSGTDSFTREKIDWEKLEKHCQTLVELAQTAVAGTTSVSTGSIFLLTQPVDPFGAEN